MSPNVKAVIAAAIMTPVCVVIASMLVQGGGLVPEYEPGIREMLFSRRALAMHVGVFVTLFFVWRRNFKEKD